MHFLYQYYNENHHQRATTDHTTLSVYSPFPGSAYTPKSEYALRRPCRTSSISADLRSSPEFQLRTPNRSSNRLESGAAVASCHDRPSPLFSPSFLYLFITSWLYYRLLCLSRKRSKEASFEKTSLVHGLTLINFVFTFFSIQSFGGNCPLLALVLQRTSTFGCTYLRIIIIFLIVCTTARTNPGRNENFK